MPLSLAPETARPQMVVFDPAVAAEVQDALRRRTQLEAEGFRLSKETPGQLVFEPPPKGDHVLVFRVLSEKGDERIVWDRRDPAQVKDAFAKFKDYLARGYKAFTLLASGKKGHAITEFDPGLEDVLLTKDVLFVPPTMPG